jgi:glycosyltransferase involved in cell wall biosynthesis
MYINPENIEDIGEKLKSLLDDNTLCEKMSKNGLAYAERFKICNIAATTMKVMRQCD